MKFSAILEIVATIRGALTISVPAIARALLSSPSLLLYPSALSRLGMAHIWKSFGAGCNEHARADKTKLITPNAHGTVLDLGAGHGHTANYLDHTKVKKYIALEPNTLMHARIRETAHAAGFTEADGTLLVLSCGAEDTKTVLSHLHGPVDTIVSVLTLCTVPDPQATIQALILEVLAPGGVLLFLEHIRSRRTDVAWWQGVWTPVWRKVFDGCHLDRPTDVWVRDVMDRIEPDGSVWEEGEVCPPEGSESDENDWFWRQFGRFVKKRQG